VSPPKTTAEIAKDIGLTERSAQQRMQAARNIIPEVKEAIRKQ
jgi:predicted transcriptional regulator